MSLLCLWFCFRKRDHRLHRLLEYGDGNLLVMQQCDNILLLVQQGTHMHTYTH